MKGKRSIRILGILGVVALSLAALPLLLTRGFAAAPTPPAAKIEAALLDQLSAAGPADIVIHFAEQPNLAAAYRMGWADRGEFVVQTLAAAAARSQRAAQAYLDGRGLRHETFVAGNELYIWGGDLAAVNALAELPEVASLRLARTYYLDPILSKAAVDDAPHALAWGITDTKANQFWSTFGVQGDGIVIAGIDTGVQWNHPALDQSYKCASNPGDAACWADPSNICGGTPCDNNGHGSHTMGTMVGDDDPSLAYQAGMAPSARWIACKGCESNSCSDYALGACGDWLLQPGGSTANRPHVVNNSWGGGGGEDWYLSRVNAWRAAGIFPAFSAGNSGSSCNTLGSPGDYQESFATAAHDSARAIAYFSSRGPSAFGHDPYTKPNISAPGVDVCSTIPTNSWSCGYSGTSMASPHTAGAVALLWSCNPSLIGQIDNTFQYLQNTANAAPAGNCGAPPDGQGNYTYGYGYLDILAAGQAHCAPAVTPTPTATATTTPTPSPTWTPRPPVTPISWANLPLVARSFPFGPTVTPTRTPTASPTRTATASPTPGAGLSEGFESGVVPPAGWSEQSQNAYYNWEISSDYAYEGNYGAYVGWDYTQNEWLLTPQLTLSSGTLGFWTMGSVYWCRDNYNNCDFNVWIVVGAPGGSDDVFVGRVEDDWSGNFVWTWVDYNLTPLLPGGPIRIGFQYVGDDGADVGLDAVSVSGSLVRLSPAP